MFKYAIIFVFVIFGFIDSQAQNQKAIDSLVVLLKHKTGSDRYFPLIDLTIEYVDHNNNKAFQYIQEAQEVALLSRDNFWIVKSRRLTVQILYKLGKIEEAVALAESTLTMAKRGNLKRESLYLVNILGVAYVIYGKYDKALQSFFQTFELSEQDLDSSFMATGLHNIGVAYYKLKDYKKGLGYFNQSLSVLESINEVDYSVLMNISLCYTYLNDFISAQKFLQKAYLFADEVVLMDQ